MTNAMSHATGTVAAPRTPSPTPDHSVLIVDADDDTRELYRQSFDADAWQIVEARDGRDALATALTHPPALVITETRLPFIDGYALCEILRDDAATRHVPILVVTSEARPSELDRARQAGADDVLTKPAVPERVLETAQALLGRCAELRERSRAVRSTAAARLARATTVLKRSDEQQRRTQSKSHLRFDTPTPPIEPPALRCPMCDGPLTYQRSHIGGVSDSNAEQWDYYVCRASCGTFQHRQRTRKVRRVR